MTIKRRLILNILLNFCPEIVSIFKVYIASVHSFIIVLLKKNLLLINQRNGQRYQRVLVLCALLNWGNTVGTNSLNILCLMFLCVFCKLVS